MTLLKGVDGNVAEESSSCCFLLVTCRLRRVAHLLPRGGGKREVLSLSLLSLSLSFWERGGGGRRERERPKLLRFLSSVLLAMGGGRGGGGVLTFRFCLGSRGVWDDDLWGILLLGMLWNILIYAQNNFLQVY